MDKKQKTKKKLNATELKILSLFRYKDTVRLDSSCNNSVQQYGIKRESFLNSLRGLKEKGLIIKIDVGTKKYKKNFTSESIEAEYGLVFVNDQNENIIIGNNEELNDEK